MKGSDILKENSNFSNSYEIRYVDINDKSHEEKKVIAFGFSEEDALEKLLGGNLKEEKDKVINEPDIIIRSIMKIGGKSLV